MTLSYRWGSDTGLLLLSSTLQEFRRGKPIEELPQTFKDFVKVAWRFGIRYIWIDCLCIIQDSHEDRIKEGVDMRHVYANSACNIAASAALDPHGGLFRTRAPEDIQPGIIKTALSSSNPDTYYIFDESYRGRQMYDGPLHNRDWVFQERFLAPRQIYWTSDSPGVPQ
jgi:hypothetical protein